MATEANVFERNQFSPELLYPNQRGTSIVYDKIKLFPDLMLTNRKFSDSWFLTKNDDIVKMAYATKECGKHKIFGKFVENKSPFFINPITYSKLNIFLSDGKINCELKCYGIDFIVAKMMCLPYRENFVYIPIVHSIDRLNYK